MFPSHDQPVPVGTHATSGTTSRGARVVEEGTNFDLGGTNYGTATIGHKYLIALLVNKADTDCGLVIREITAFGDYTPINESNVNLSKGNNNCGSTDTNRFVYTKVEAWASSTSRMNRLMVYNATARTLAGPPPVYYEPAFDNFNVSGDSFNMTGRTVDYIFSTNDSTPTINGNLTQESYCNWSTKGS